MQAACAPHGDAASSLAADGDVKEDLRARRQWREHAPSACAETAGRTLLVTLGPFFAAEAVARQATISLSGDIGNATRGKSWRVKARDVLLRFSFGEKKAYSQLILLSRAPR